MVSIRDGHANADDAEVCGCDSEDKICMRIVGKKTISGQFGTGPNLAPDPIWHQECEKSQFGTGPNLAPRV